jgi:hypothetical protein
MSAVSVAFRRTDPPHEQMSATGVKWHTWNYTHWQKLGWSTYRMRLRWKWRTIWAVVNPTTRTPIVTTNKIDCFDDDDGDRRCAFDPLFPGTNR